MSLIFRRFKPIEGHERYGVNAKGEVINFKTNRILKPDDVNGYFRVTIDGEKKYIHKLVAEAFVPNPNGYIYILHRDYNNLNNEFTNLVWATKSDIHRPHGRPVSL